MDNDVFQAALWLLGEFKVDPDASLFDVAGAPLGLHLHHTPIVQFNPNDHLSLGNQIGNDCFELLAITTVSLTF